MPLFSRRFLWPRIAFMLLIRRTNWGAYILIRLIAHFHARGQRRRLQWATTMLRRDFGCFVQPTAQIGPGLRLPHPNGIVIGSGVSIGARCTIFHQVTFGARTLGKGFSADYPRLGNDVTVFAGAKLVGPITIGDGAVVGANAVVTCDVPPYHRAVGIPARVSPMKNAGPNGLADKALAGLETNSSEAAQSSGADAAG